MSAKADPHALVGGPIYRAPDPACRTRATRWSQRTTASLESL
jgi:hypothetical protein